MYLKLYWLTSTQTVWTPAYVAGLCDYSCNTERNIASSIFSVFFHSMCCNLLHNYVSIGPVHWLGKEAAPVFFPVITGNMFHQAADCAAVLPDWFYSTYASAKQMQCMLYVHITLLFTREVSCSHIARLPDIVGYDLLFLLMVSRPVPWLWSFLSSSARYSYSLRLRARGKV